LDPLVPNQVRYRAALHSEDINNIRWRRFGQVDVRKYLNFLAWLCNRRMDWWIWH